MAGLSFLWRRGVPSCLPALVGTILFTGCVSPGEPFRAGSQPGEIVHQDSSFSFPARIGSFARVSGRQYDPKGRDISVGYNGDIPVVVTVYVYPRSGRTLEADLVRQSAEVLAAYPGSELLGTRSVVVSPQGIAARAVSFGFLANFRGEQQQMYSELVLAQSGSRFVKYRITYPVSLTDLAAEDSSKFLQHFAWPP